MIQYGRTKMIKLVKVLFAKDTGLFQKVRCAFFGKQQDLNVLNLYGISFNPPDNSFGVAFKANGYDNNIFIAVDKPESRFTGLAKGELKIGNQSLTPKTYIHFKADGSIEIKANTTVDIIAPTVNISGDVVVVGTVTADNFISTGLPGVDFNTHIHTGDSGGDTGIPK